jgi:hypothetical protein
MSKTDREALIRRTFEAYRDLTWAQELVPKFRELGVTPEILEEHHRLWNRHAEQKDWAWWQEQAKGDSTRQLENMLIDCAEMLDAIGVLQWGGQERLKRILDATPEQHAQPREQSKDKGRDL